MAEQQSTVLDPSEISFDPPPVATAQKSSYDQSEVSFTPPEKPYVAPVGPGPRGAPPRQSSPTFGPPMPGQKGAPPPIPASPTPGPTTSDHDESLLDPLIDVLGKHIRPDLPEVYQKYLKLPTPVQEAIGDAIRGFVTPENAYIAGGLAAASAIPLVGEAADVGAAGYFSKQMIDSGVDAQAQMEDFEKKAVQARKDGDQTKAAFYDDRATKAQASKWISSTLAGLLTSGVSRKGAEKLAERVPAEASLTPEEVRDRLKGLAESPVPPPDRTVGQTANPSEISFAPEAENPAAPTAVDPDSISFKIEAPAATPPLTEQSVDSAITQTPEETPVIPAGQPQGEAPAENTGNETSVEAEAPAGQPAQPEKPPPSVSPPHEEGTVPEVPKDVQQAEQLKESPVFTKEPETVRNSEFSAAERQIRSLAERNLPAVLPEIDQAITLHDEGRTGEAIVKLETVRQKLHGAGKDLALANMRSEGIEAPEGFAGLSPEEIEAHNEQVRADKKESPEFKDLVDQRAEFLFHEWAESARESREAQGAYKDQGRHSQDLNYDAQVLQDEKFKESQTPGSSGVKEGSVLDGIPEGPQQLIDASESGRGKLYEKAMNRFRDYVREQEGDQIRQHLEATTTEHGDLGQGEDDGDLNFDFGKDEPDFGARMDARIADTREEIRRLTRETATGNRPGAAGPGDLALAYVKLGAYHLAKGIVDFKDWSEQMIDDLGEKIRPKLRDIYSRSLERLRAAKDAGLMGSVKLDAALERELTTKYVKNEPFDFKIGKDDRATGKSLREEFSGLKNSRIVRVAQLADDIRKAVPGKIDREALAWYKDALARSPKDPLAVIRKAIADDRFKDYKSQLERALTLKPAQIAELDRIGQYYGEAGRVSRQLGTIGTVREEYQNRLYAPVPPKDFVRTEMSGGVRPTTSHAKARVFDTMFDAVEDPETQERYKGKGPFAITDIADALEVHGREMARVNTSHQLADALSNNGVGKWVDPKRVPVGWNKVEGLERHIPIKDENGDAVLSKKTGNQVVANHVFAAPKGIVDAIRSINDRDKFGEIPIVKALQKYQGMVKTVDLSFSLFHHFTMAMQAIYQGNYKGLIDLPRLSKVLNTPAFHEMETDFTRNGGMTSTVESNHDILRDLVKKEPGTFSKIANLPIVKQALQLSDRNTNFLFGKMQRMLKVQDYAGKVASWIGKHSDATPEELTAAKRGIAQQNNAAYGGLNWEALGMTKSNLSLLRTALLAPDWTISNGQLVTEAFKKGPEGNAARAHYIRAAIAGMVLTEGMNKLLTGHTTDKNPAGHKLEIQIAPGVWVSFFRGGIGDAVKYWSNLQQNGLLKGSAQFAQSKLAPLPRTGIGVLSGTEYSGVPITRAKSNLGKDADYLSYIGRSAGPIPFGVGNLVKYAADPNRTAVGAAGIAAGVARYAPASKAATIKSYLSSGSSDALDKAEVAIGAPKPRKGETATVSELRKELSTKLIDEKVALETRGPFDKLPKETQQKRLRAAINAGHKSEEALTSRPFTSDTAAQEYLRSQIQRIDQRNARRESSRP